MSSLVDISLNGEAGYYDPKEDIKPENFVLKSLYPSHIVEVESRDVDVKQGKHKGTVYNITVEIAKECSEKTYNNGEKDINGSSYVGRKVKSRGIWRFHQPGDNDSFEANNGGNEGYLLFCEAIGYKTEQTEIVVNDEPRVVNKFPLLNKEDMIGKAVLVYIDSYKWKNRDGEYITSIQAKEFSKWSDAKNRDIELEELPF